MRIVYTVDINCALGAAQTMHVYMSLVDLNPGRCHVYPKAGLPNVMCGCDEDHEVFSTKTLDYAKDGLLNLVGSCCRSLPSHIAAVVEKVKDGPPRALPELPNYPYMQISCVEPCLLKPDSGFHWVGERCHLLILPNVTGWPMLTSGKGVLRTVHEACRHFGLQLRF